MKIGFLSSILDGWSYNEVIDTAKNMGYKAVEVACWPNGKAERRYAGVSHINVDRVLSDDEYAKSLIEYAHTQKVELSALAYYPNVMDRDPTKRNMAIEHLKTVIKASEKLGIYMVTTFIGRDQMQNVDNNLKLIQNVWPPIIKLAEELHVKIAIENCPMLFGAEQWPGGQNIMTSPQNWERVFEILNSDIIGINFDPSHCIWQFIDYIKPIHVFKDKIFHIHFKDIKLDHDKLDKVGILSYPLDYMTPKLPGLGDINWGRFVSALTDINYTGYACVEVEDRAFEGSKESVFNSLKISKRYLEQFVI